MTPMSRPPALPPLATRRSARRVALRVQVLGARDEVGERVHLVLEPSGLVPRPAHLAAAAHVGHREHEAAIEQRQAGRPERRVGRDLVRAVAVEQCRCGTVDRGVAPVHERDRDTGAVGRRRPEPGRDVAGRVVPAEYGLGLHDPGVAVVEVVVEIGERRDERRVAVPQHGRVELGVRADPHAVHGIGHLDLVDLARTEVQDAQALEPVGAFTEHHVVRERRRGVELDVVAVRHERNPVLGTGIGARRLDELEVAGRAAPVRDDEEPVAAVLVPVVLDRVLVPLFAGGDDDRLPLGRVGRDEPHLRRELRRDVDEHEPPAPGPFDADEEALVVLAQHAYVAASRACRACAATPRAAASRRRAGRRSTCASRRPTRGRT